MVNRSEMWLPSFSKACCPVKKDKIQSQRWAGKPLSWNTWVTWPMLMLLKNPDMSNKRRAPVLPVAHVAWMQWARVVMVSTVPQKTDQVFFTF